MSFGRSGKSVGILIELASNSLMDPKHAADVLKHLEKQKELCKNAHNSMSQDLHTLKVEEEMLMRKFKEFMEAHGFVWEVDKDILMHKFREYVEDQNTRVKKYTDHDQSRALIEAVEDDEDNDQERALVTVPSEEQ